MKLVLVSPNCRGRGVAKKLVRNIGQIAAESGVKFLLCTIHPDNKPSQTLFTGIGYLPRKLVTTSYGDRVIYEFALYPHT
jgi:ribosomal protein S18 acetylase RimI-like enzyme